MIPPERYQSLGELLHDALIQFKPELALLELSRKRVAKEMSYADVKHEAEHLAAHFARLGVGPGSRVAIVLQNQARWPLAATAIFLRGATLVPIDYKLSGPEIETLLAHSRADVLVTEYATWRTLERTPKGELPKHVVASEMPPTLELPEFVVSWEDALATEGEHFAFAAVKRDDIATIVYSSGTGGDPKGCQLTHGNYLEQYRLLLARFPLAPGDRYFSILPSNHAIDFMVGFLGPFACGATVVHQRALRPEMINHVMRFHGITHMAVVPLILEAFERRLEEQLEEKGDLAKLVVDGLRAVNATLTLDRPRRGITKRLMKPVLKQLGPDLKLLFAGGAFVDPGRAQRFYELGIPVIVGYGLTEACTVLTVNDLAPYRSDSVGRPLDDVEVEIRRKGPDGKVGEVWVRGPTVFAGYLDDPDQTAEALHEGWLRTGDLGYLDASGHLHLVGRAKNMIVTAGGKNIYPEDVEGVFEGLAVEELAVFSTNYLWPDLKLEEEELLVVVRPKDAPSGSNGESRAIALDAATNADLRKRNLGLADYKRVRSLLLWADEFPRTASMKVKRGILAEQLREKAEPSARERLL